MFRICRFCTKKKLIRPDEIECKEIYFNSIAKSASAKRNKGVSEENTSCASGEEKPNRSSRGSLNERLSNHAKSKTYEKTARSDRLHLHRPKTFEICLHFTTTRKTLSGILDCN